MRLIILLLTVILLLVPMASFAQDSMFTGNRFAMAGMGYFADGHPQYQGMAAVGIPLTSDGKAISYTDMKIAIVQSGGQLTVAGFNLRYTLHPGLAYKMLSYGSWSIYGLAAPGFAADGDTFVGSFEYGGFIHKAIGKGWGVLGVLSAEHTGGTTSFDPIIGITKKF